MRDNNNRPLGQDVHSRLAGMGVGPNVLPTSLWVPIGMVISPEKGVGGRSQYGRWGRGRETQNLLMVPIYDTIYKIFMSQKHSHLL
jgi:hypothetical protein